MPPNSEKRKHDTVMDVTEEQVARVYAQAFMGVAAKSPNATALVEELESLVDDVLDRFPQAGASAQLVARFARSKRSNCSTACSAAGRRPKCSTS